MPMHKDGTHLDGQPRQPSNDLGPFGPKKDSEQLGRDGQAAFDATEEPTEALEEIGGTFTKGPKYSSLTEEGKADIPTRGQPLLPESTKAPKPND